MVLRFVSRDAHRRLDTAITRAVRTFSPDEREPALRRPRPFPWTLDPFLHRRDLDLLALAALSRPLLRIAMVDGVWILNVANIGPKCIYWTDNRGERHLVAATTEPVWSADRLVASGAVSWNGVFTSSRGIVGRHIPEEVTTSVAPRVLVEAFHSCFDQAQVWKAVEERFGPRLPLPRQEQEQIAKEIWAPVRTYLKALGAPDRIKAEVLRRERRPLVERWLEEVLA